MSPPLGARRFECERRLRRGLHFFQPEFFRQVELGQRRHVEQLIDQLLLLTGRDGDVLFDRSKRTQSNAPKSSTRLMTLRESPDRRER